MRVLVTGGAGYIGSVVVEELLAAGAERVVVLDDLSKGHAEAVTAPATLTRGDFSDVELVEKVCRAERIDAAVHMGASSLVGESVTDPAKYFRNNVSKGLQLLDGLKAAGVRRFVFSSTAAVFGEPAGTPIDETTPTAPTNPYGESKLAFERALRWYAAAYDMSYVSLRYFNAGGATVRNGEQHEPETHLIPLVLDVARGKREQVKIFGDDYATQDGTCVRDYIHVSDLARAHVLGIQSLHDAQAGTSAIYNLGCGGGYSVREVIDAVSAVTGKPIRAEMAPRRAGDPAVLVASSEKIRNALGWVPQKQKVEIIVEDAWKWLLANPHGYGQHGEAA